MPLQVIAHGGYVSQYQPNTYSAIKSSLDLKGCRGIFMPLVLTRDAVPILAEHEDLLSLTGVARQIHEMDWDALQTQKFLKQFAFPFGDFRYAQSENLCTLERAIAELGGLDFTVYLQTDAPADSKRRHQLAEKAAALIQKSEHAAQFVICSKNISRLQKVQKAFPKQKIAPIMEGTLSLMQFFLHLGLGKMRFSAVWLQTKHLKKNIIRLLNYRRAHIGVIMEEQRTNERPDAIALLTQQFEGLKVAEVITRFPERWVSAAQNVQKTATSEKQKG